MHPTIKLLQAALASTSFPSNLELKQKVDDFVESIGLDMEEVDFETSAQTDTKANEVEEILNELDAAREDTNEAIEEAATEPSNDDEIEDDAEV